MEPFLISLSLFLAHMIHIWPTDHTSKILDALEKRHISFYSLNVMTKVDIWWSYSSYRYIGKALSIWQISWQQGFLLAYWCKQSYLEAIIGEWVAFTQWYDDSWWLTHQVIRPRSVNIYQYYSQMLLLDRDTRLGHSWIKSYTWNQRKAGGCQLMLTKVWVV